MFCRTLPIILFLTLNAGIATARLQSSSDQSDSYCNNQDEFSKLRLVLTDMLDRSVQQTPPPERAGAQEIAGIFGKDDRAIADVSTYPNSAFPKIYLNTANGSGICTGTMISACHVLTASHCITQGKQIFTPLESAQIQMPGQAKKIAVERVKFAFMSDDKSAGKRRIVKNDFAILKVAGRPGENNYLSIFNATPGDLKERGINLFSRRKVCESQIHLAGYHGDINYRDASEIPLRIQDNVEVVDIKGDNFYSRADTFRGSSGGPLYCFDSAGVPRVVGVHSNGLGSISDPSKNPMVSDKEVKNLSGHLSSSSFFDFAVKIMKENPCD